MALDASLVVSLTSRLDDNSIPTAFSSIQGAHQDLENRAVSLSNSAELFATTALNADNSDASFLVVATTLANLNESLDKVEQALAVAEVGLELLIVARAEELAEQEEQVETAKGLSDLFGISLDPWDYCFIATAAYGIPAAEQIDVLREFRDDVLLQCGLGQAFVGLYYEYSPPVAAFIFEHESLRTVVREGFVDPLVWVVSKTRGLWEPATAP